MEVWADLTCPWCYLGKRRLERAISAFEHPHAVLVRYRSFERPWPEGTVPRVTGAGDAYVAALLSPSHARRRRPTRGWSSTSSTPYRRSTFDAHRLMHLGAAEGGLALQAAVAERMFAAHFCEGRALDDRRVLQRVAPEAGLDEHRVAAVLAGDEVRRGRPGGPARGGAAAAVGGAVRAGRPADRARRAAAGRRAAGDAAGGVAGPRGAAAPPADRGRALRVSPRRGPSGRPRGAPARAGRPSSAPSSGWGRRSRPCRARCRRRWPARPRRPR